MVSDRASAKRGAKQVRGTGESRISWAGVNDEREQEPGGGEADRPQERREGGLTSTPRQYPLWERRGGWGRMTMISCSVEISIAGGGGEVPSVGRFSFSFFSFYIMYLFFMVPELACSASYGVKKTLNPTTAPFTSSWEQSNTPKP